MRLRGITFSIVLATTAMVADEVPEPPLGWMCVPGDLVFSENFDPETLSDRWGFKEDFALREGGLKRTDFDPAEEKRVFLKDPAFHNTVVQFDFKFSGKTTNLRLVTGSGGGYNSITEITPDYFQVNTPKDAEAGIEPSHVGECVRRSHGSQWQTMTVEYWGNEIVAYLGDREYVLGRHPIIDRTRRYFAFQFDRPGAVIDNVRVWEAAAQHDDWERSRMRLLKDQSERAGVKRSPVDRYRYEYTNLKSRLTLEDQVYRDLVAKHAEMKERLEDRYPEAFATHKELTKGILKKKLEVKANDPEFKLMETAVHKARRAEDTYVVSHKPALAEVPKELFRSELGIVRKQLEKKGDKELARLVAETAKRQKELEARFPEAFVSVEGKVAERKAARLALNDDPEFKAGNREIADAYQAIKAYEREADPRLLQLEAESKAFLDALDSKK